MENLNGGIIAIVFVLFAAFMSANAKADGNNSQTTQQQHCKQAEKLRQPIPQECLPPATEEKSKEEALEKSVLKETALERIKHECEQFSREHDGEVGVYVLNNIEIRCDQDAEIKVY